MYLNSFYLFFIIINRLAFQEDDSNEMNKFDGLDLFEKCSDFEYEIGEGSIDDNNLERLQRLNSLKRYNKRKRRQLPKIPANKKRKLNFQSLYIIFKLIMILNHV